MKTSPAKKSIATQPIMAISSSRLHHWKRWPFLLLVPFVFVAVGAFFAWFFIDLFQNGLSSWEDRTVYRVLGKRGYVIGYRFALLDAIMYLAIFGGLGLTAIGYSVAFIASTFSAQTVKIYERGIAYQSETTKWFKPAPRRKFWWEQIAEIKVMTHSSDRENQQFVTRLADRKIAITEDDIPRFMTMSIKPRNGVADHFSLGMWPASKVAEVLNTMRLYHPIEFVTPLSRWG